MAKAVNEDFLLYNDEARTLFHKYAEPQPIIDYHCHIDPREICEDKQYTSITELWLGGDHYKWRLMRQCGFDEELITGKADDRQRFKAWAKTLEQAIGNPLYHWSHLELQRYFDCTLPINSANADEIYDKCNDVLSSGKLTARKIIEASNVVAIGTTDDPCDSLEFHRLMREDDTLNCTVIPTFRPDPILLIGNEGFAEYVQMLAKSADTEITDLDGLKDALLNRMEHFDRMGCRSSDQSAAAFPCTVISERECGEIFAKALSGKTTDERERSGFVTHIMLFLAENYARLGWVMQLHFGVVRNTSSRQFAVLGKDTGFDRIDSAAPIETLAAFLDELDKRESLPKTVLYSLDPNMDTAIDVLAKCFNEAGVRGKVQHGAAWWFNDNMGSIRSHLQSLCEQGVLGTFIGMLTDSRCMLSYTRHEYFRRILCGFIGDMASRGEIFFDEKTLGALVENVCYFNAKKFFML